MRLKPPCSRECEKRFPGCHSQCEEWKEYEEKRNANYAKRQESKDAVMKTYINSARFKK